MLWHCVSDALFILIIIRSTCWYDLVRFVLIMNTYCTLRSWKLLDEPIYCSRYSQPARSLYISSNDHYYIWSLVTPSLSQSSNRLIQVNESTLRLGESINPRFNQSQSAADGFLVLGSLEYTIFTYISNLVWTELGVRWIILWELW